MTAHVQVAPEPVHLVALSGCHTLADKIRYACEHNRPNPTAGVVRDWLIRYGVDTHSAFVNDMVDTWREENGITDPGIASALFADPDREHGRNRYGDTVTARPATPAAGARGFYLGAIMAGLVSVDTSWRFFAHNLHITDLRERVVMFAVIEVALVACGYGMRANVIRSGRPGAPRLFAWILCGMAGYMAWQLSGVAEGIARVALGPVLGLVMLHLALGIEIRAGMHKVTTWARIGWELRQRVLSRIGLADDARDAVARTRDRAARRVARLSLGAVVPFRSARVARALRTSNVAHDPAARARMLAELAAIRHAGDLAALDQPSPWRDPPTGGANTPAGVHDPVPGTVTEGSGNDGPTSSVNGAVNTDPPGADSAPSAVRQRRTRATATSRSQARKPRARRKLADYVTEAREHLEPGVMVTPAWVRDVIPGCPRSSSKSVADTLNQQLQNTGTEVTA